MKAVPTGFDSGCLVHALEQHWGITVRELTYVPLGFGAHHWRVSHSCGADLFLAIHELDLTGLRGADRSASLGQLRRALSTAHWLATVAYLDFAVSPIPDGNGAVVRPVVDRFALSFYPWLDAEPIHDPDGIRTAGVIARLHAVTQRLPQDLVPTEDFVIPHRDALDDALNSLMYRGPPVRTPSLRAHDYLNTRTECDRS